MLRSTPSAAPIRSPVGRPSQVLTDRPPGTLRPGVPPTYRPVVFAALGAAGIAERAPCKRRLGTVLGVGEETARRAAGPPPGRDGGAAAVRHVGALGRGAAQGQAGLTAESGASTTGRMTISRNRPPADHQLGDPYNPLDGDFVGGLRRDLEPLDELRESMRAFGWIKEAPAIKDEHGVVIDGHRRLAVARELGIAEVVRIIPFGDGDEADDERLKFALAANSHRKPFAEADRRHIAEHVTPGQDWDMTKIGAALTIEPEPEAVSPTTSQRPSSTQDRPGESSTRTGWSNSAPRPWPSIRRSAGRLFVPARREPPGRRSARRSGFLSKAPSTATEWPSRTRRGPCLGPCARCERAGRSAGSASGRDGGAAAVCHVGALGRGAPAPADAFYTALSWMTFASAKPDRAAAIAWSRSAAECW